MAYNLCMRCITAGIQLGKMVEIEPIEVSDPPPEPPVRSTPTPPQDRLFDA